MQSPFKKLMCKYCIRCRPCDYKYIWHNSRLIREFELPHKAEKSHYYFAVAIACIILRAETICTNLCCFVNVSRLCLASSTTDFSTSNAPSRSRTFNYTFTEYIQLENTNQTHYQICVFAQAWGQYDWVLTEFLFFRVFMDRNERKTRLISSHLDRTS